MTTTEFTFDGETDLADEVKEFLELVVFQSVWSGVMDEDEAVDYCTEQLEYEYDDEVPEEDEIRLFVQAAMEKKRTEETTWAEQTDCDRLTQAFEQLTANGILSIENAGCDTSDGWAWINTTLAEDWDEEQRTKVRGACFYHWQTLCHAVEGFGLMLYFGAITEEEDDSELSVEIGKEIVEVLKKNGFEPSWEGSSDHAIGLPIEWKRRYGPTADTDPPD